MMRRWIAVFYLVLSAWILAQEEASTVAIEQDDVRGAEALIGLSLTDEERALMMEDLSEALDAYHRLRAMPWPNDLAPALVFDPFPAEFSFRRSGQGPIWPEPEKLERPDHPEAMAFASIAQLGALLRGGQLSSVDLTKMYLSRLKQFGTSLECVVTLTETRALEMARRADEELAAGVDRGPLHGIPYGAKDLFAVRGYPTTWGAVPYQNQVLDMDAAVIERLDQAGAVLVAKLTLGALAWGDVWFGGTTRNPWNPEQGSSGSSAGSASATAAGLVAFSLGTETWGSIVSPCTRCGVTGLRPTFGRVSRYGAMALSWSMDKVGPIARSAEDCALVFDAIRGEDPRDACTVSGDFEFRALNSLEGIRIGYVKADFEGSEDGQPLDRATLQKLGDLGANLVSVQLPDMDVSALALILSAEAAAAFDELTRSNQDDRLVRQIRQAWPNVFRAARFIPAVEYIQANRARTRLIRDMNQLLDTVDLLVTPSFAGDILLTTNLTGHPCVVLPNGFSTADQPHSVTLVGRLMDEARLLAVARCYQLATAFHTTYPAAFLLEESDPGSQK